MGNVFKFKKKEGRGRGRGAYPVSVAGEEPLTLVTGLARNVGSSPASPPLAQPQEKAAQMPKLFTVN